MPEAKHLYVGNQVVLRNGWHPDWGKQDSGRGSWNGSHNRDMRIEASTQEDNETRSYCTFQASLGGGRPCSTPHFQESRPLGQSRRPGGHPPPPSVSPVVPSVRAVNLGANRRP